MKMMIYRRNSRSNVKAYQIMHPVSKNQCLQTKADSLSNTIKCNKTKRKINQMMNRRKQLRKKQNLMQRTQMVLQRLNLKKRLNQRAKTKRNRQKSKTIKEAKKRKPKQKVAKMLAKRLQRVKRKRMQLHLNFQKRSSFSEILLAYPNFKKNMKVHCGQNTF